MGRRTGGAQASSHLNDVARSALLVRPVQTCNALRSRLAEGQGLLGEGGREPPAVVTRSLGRRCAPTHARLWVRATCLILAYKVSSIAAGQLLQTGWP